MGLKSAMTKEAFENTSLFFCCKTISLNLKDFLRVLTDNMMSEKAQYCITLIQPDVSFLGCIIDSKVQPQQHQVYPGTANHS